MPAVGRNNRNASIPAIVSRSVFRRIQDFRSRKRGGGVEAISRSAEAQSGGRKVCAPSSMSLESPLSQYPGSTYPVHFPTAPTVYVSCPELARYRHRPREPGHWPPQHRKTSPGLLNTARHRGSTERSVLLAFVTHSKGHMASRTLTLLKRLVGTAPVKIHGLNVRIESLAVP